jgi:hypothetical protein
MLGQLGDEHTVKTKPVNMIKTILVDFSEGFVAPPKLNNPPEGA